jgi:hypothetical protein
MRFLVAAFSLGLLGSPAHSEERWTEPACKAVQDLESFYYSTAPDLTSKAWAIRPLLVLERDHCGAEVQLKLEESDKVIRLHLWPAHVCTLLANTKGVRSVLAKPLDEHCVVTATGKSKP